MKEYSHKPLWILLSISSALYIILTGTLLCATSEISKEKPVVVYVTIGFLSLCYLLILIWSLIVMYRNSSEKCLNDILFKKNNTNASLYVPALLLDSQNFWVKIESILPWKTILYKINQENHISCTRLELGILVLKDMLHDENIDSILKLIQDDINVQYFVGVNLYSGMLSLNKSLYDEQKFKKISNIVRKELFEFCFQTNGYSKES